jgi:hypothetical protein
LIAPPGQGDGRAAQADESAANRASGREGDLPKPLAQASNSPEDQPCSQGAGPYAAIDPGRSKCGLVISNDQASAILYAAVLPPQRALAQLRQWQEQHSPLVAVLLGNGTGSGPWRPWLAPIAPLILVPEAGTTLAARQRYWQLEPAQGWRRLLPRGLRQPPRDWDDVVAQLLLERHLGRSLPRRLAQGQGPTP